MTKSETDRETMIAIGLGLYGDRWVPKMAEALGAFHPKKTSISASHIHSIASGRKPFPSWVRDALPQAIAYEISVRENFQRQLKDKGFSTPPH